MTVEGLINRFIVALVLLGNYREDWEMLWDYEGWRDELAVYVNPN